MKEEDIKAIREEYNIPEGVPVGRDPVEDTEEFKKVEKEVDALAEDMSKEWKGMLGYCHIFWNAKKRILKEKYNIDWHTPAETCPWINFD